MEKKRPLNRVRFRRAKAKNAERDGLGRLSLSDINGDAKLSVTALVLANLVPLVGVLYFDWNYRLVIALFWIENLIIGVFNVAKMCGTMIVTKRMDVVTPLFFVFHYGVFCAAHGFFLWTALDLGERPAPALIFGFETSGVFTIFTEGLAVLNGFITLYSPIILWGVLGLILSRLVSFVENFLLKGEIFKVTAKQLMAKPYGKIIAMHAGIMLGALAIDKFGSSLSLLLVIIGFKVTVDVFTHLKQHRTAVAEI